MSDAPGLFPFMIAYNTALTEDERPLNEALSAFGRLERVFPGLFVLAVDIDTADEHGWDALEIADQLEKKLGESFAAVVIDPNEIVTVGELEQRSTEIFEALGGADEEEE